MSVRMRHTRAHTKNRRSHHALKGVRLSTCSKCQAKHMRHHMCENCGTYREKEVVNVLAKLDKKEKKLKEREFEAKEKQSHEEETGDTNKPLNMAELSKKPSRKPSV